MNYSFLFFIVTLLGILEGFTEFLPVSSTGHLIIVGNFFKLKYSIFQNGLFEVFIQSGAILAVLVVYRAKFLDLAKNPLSKQTLKISSNILLASLPIIILGLFFYDFIMNVLFKNTDIIALMLILGGIVFLIVEKNDVVKENSVDVWNTSWKQALVIGVAQVFALIPGTSRSGATIIGGLLCGLNRKASAEFSFFVAIPVILGASLLGLIRNFSSINTEMFLILMFGFLVSFVASLVFIRWFIEFVSKRTFLVFGYYRIILGLLIVYLL